MIDKNQLMSLSSFTQPFQAEKDYIQELFLSTFYTNSYAVVFKGGTALSKFYGSSRFSDDLDFVLQDKELINTVIREVEKSIGTISNEYSTLVLRNRLDNDTIAFELSIRGPLFESLNKYQHLKVEINKKSSVVEPVAKLKGKGIYPDLKPYLALVLDEKEILAEKVEALLFRRVVKARDLFDLQFLLSKRVELEPSLVDRKMRESGHVFSKDKLERRLSAISEIWEKELKRLIPEDKYLTFREARGSLLGGLEESEMI